MYFSCVFFYNCTCVYIHYTTSEMSDVYFFTKRKEIVLLLAVPMTECYYRYVRREKSISIQQKQIIFYFMLLSVNWRHSQEYIKYKEKCHPPLKRRLNGFVDDIVYEYNTHEILIIPPMCNFTLHTKCWFLKLYMHIRNPLVYIHWLPSFTHTFCH